MPDAAWTRGEKIALAALGVAVSALAATFLVPEGRRFFGLDSATAQRADVITPPQPQPAAASPQVQGNSTFTNLANSPNTADNISTSANMPNNVTLSAPSSTSTVDLRSSVTTAEQHANAHLRGQSPDVPSLRPASSPTQLVAQESPTNAAVIPPNPAPISTPTDNILANAASSRTQSNEAPTVTITSARDDPPPQQSRSAAVVPRVDPLSVFEGSWDGNVFQRGSRPYTVFMSLHADHGSTSIGEISYPELDCGGRLELVAASSGVLQVNEILTYGLSKCVGGGIIVIEMSSSNRARWRWTNGNSNYDVSSNIVRR